MTNTLGDLNNYLFLQLERLKVLTEQAIEKMKNVKKNMLDNMFC